MGTTTNNGWPTPVATDLVKDGWEAIKDLGDAIDTTLGVYAPSTSGLTLLNTTSFSGVSSQTFNDVFSTTYDNYKIIYAAEAGSTVSNTIRLRVSGTDASGADYGVNHSSILWQTTSGPSNNGGANGATSATFNKFNTQKWFGVFSTTNNG
jgi:hypothetical protein